MLQVVSSSLWVRWILVHPYRPTWPVITPRLGQILNCAAKGYHRVVICVKNLNLAVPITNPIEVDAFLAAGIVNDATSPASPQPRPREADPIHWLPSAGENICLHNALHFSLSIHSSLPNVVISLLAVVAIYVGAQLAWSWMSMAPRDRAQWWDRATKKQKKGGAVPASAGKRQQRSGSGSAKADSKSSKPNAKDSRGSRSSSAHSELPPFDSSWWACLFRLGRNSQRQPSGNDGAGMDSRTSGRTTQANSDKKTAPKPGVSGIARSERNHSPTPSSTASEASIYSEGGGSRARQPATTDRSQVHEQGRQRATPSVKGPGGTSNGKPLAAAAGHKGIVKERST